MMRKIKLYILAVAASLLTTSCLDKYPTDSIQADQAITTVEEANQAIIGIYAAFKSSYLYSGNLTLLPDIQADLVYAVNGYSNVYGDIWRWNILPTNTDIEAVYGALYAVIGNCNFFFEQIEKFEDTIVDDTEYEKLQQYKGEAYFARALAYSELIKCFCKAYDPATASNELGVALVTSYSNAGVIKRASLEESYQLVLSDLEKASELLEPEDDEKDIQFYNTSYFTYYTVQSLLARVYLYMQDWDNAIKYSSLVIDSGKFLLSDANVTYTGNYSYYAYMWMYDQATEIIWKVGFTGTSYGGKLGQVFLNYDYSSYKPDYVPGNQALGLYDSADLRYSTFFASVQTGYAHGLTCPLLIKYHGNQDFFESYNLLHVNMPKVFRLSEQYLIRTEAYCRKNDFGKAVDDLTVLRKARYENYGSTVLNQDTWLDEISDERVRELFMEGFRLNDLKRWGRGFEREPQTQTISNGNNLKIDADDPLFVWPIPQHEIDAPGSQIEPNESNK